MKPMTGKESFTRSSAVFCQAASSGLSICRAGLPRRCMEKIIWSVALASGVVFL